MIWDGKRDKCRVFLALVPVAFGTGRTTHSSYGTRAQKYLDICRVSRPKARVHVELSRESDEWNCFWPQNLEVVQAVNRCAHVYIPHFPLVLRRF